jgi:hypothetical protein
LLAACIATTFGIKTGNAAYSPELVDADNIGVFRPGGMTNSRIEASHYFIRNTRDFEECALTDEVRHGVERRDSGSGNAWLLKIRVGVHES